MPKPNSALSESQVTPEPQLETRTRRQFSAEYKLKILAEADACPHGELGVLLRREKSRSSFHTTRVSPGRSAFRQLARPGRSSRLPDAWSSYTCAGSTPAALSASHCKSVAWGEPSALDAHVANQRPSHFLGWDHGSYSAHASGGRASASSTSRTCASRGGRSRSTVFQTIERSTLK
jgi:hypothetical protein